MMILRSVCIGTVFFISAASFAGAETYDPTTLTASAIFAKAGAAYGTLEPAAYVETTLTHTPSVDDTTVTVMQGDDYRTTVTGGGFTDSYGYYQKQSWTQDYNGVTTLRNNFRTKVDPNDLALQHPDDPKYNVHVLGITQTGPRQYVVELNPPGGYDEFRYYDVKTSLLTATVAYTRDRHRHVTDYTDYRNTFGEAVPFRIHSYDGRPENDTVTTVASYLRADGTADVSIPPGRALYTYTGAQPLKLPARFTPEGIIVRAVVNGRGLDFLLDSGADGLVIDPGVAHQLGFAPYGRTSATIGGGDVDFGELRIPVMSIGNLDMHDVVFDATGFEQDAGDAKAVGLIGFDFFANGIIAIDFKHQTVELYSRDAFDPKAMGLSGLPLQLDDGVPRTDVWVEGVHGHFLVDTGSFAMLLYRDYVHKLPSAVVTAQSQILTVGGTMPVSVVNISDLIFGGVKYRTAQAMEPNISTFDIADYDGVLGRDVLAGYQNYFDYGDGMLFVKPDL